MDLQSQINLSTSDDPPVVLSVSRIALIANSRVFADMLAVGNDSEALDDSIPLSETEEELEVFVHILEGRDEEAQQTLRRYSEGQWEKLANLADKYDCMVVRKVVETKIWQIEAVRGSAELAFTLATLTGAEHLIRHTAKGAVLIRDLDHEDFHAAAVWKERLTAWRTVHKVVCFDHIRNTLRRLKSEDFPVYFRNNCSNPARQQFADAVWDSFDICASPSLSLNKFKEIRGQGDHKPPDYWIQAATELQRNLSRWPEFALSGTSFGDQLALQSKVASTGTPGMKEPGRSWWLWIFGFFVLWIAAGFAC